MDNFYILVVTNMIIGIAVMGCVTIMLLVYVTKQHDDYVKALKQEQQDSYKTYKLRIDGATSTIGTLQLKIQSLVDGSIKLR